MKPWFALPVVLVLAAAGCGGSSAALSGSRPPSSSAAPNPFADPLTGSWQTPLLPTASYVATYRRAGATPGALQQFQAALSGAGRNHRYVIHIAGGQWVELEQHDDGTPEIGWSGTYTLRGSTVQATDPQYGCHYTYRIALSGDSLRIRLLSDTPEAPPQCGRTDSWPQRSIYETAAFKRVS